ncbi:SRPBCC family protein [Streptacidiphilus sp. P02-A3a]|uniref:SRPBCC family protein n=1 Tax=Streptacidiphilus sp. P02-A3a TaxID=2704468 RepID=UPI0015FB81FC|nr:SRPBCC family protein [Streptacidiphilus sp. P02-A3a]QMU69062.1 hypothetical protein GXP74_13245 [Streptacidiphilus sp. P02-A3a]
MIHVDGLTHPGVPAPADGGRRVVSVHAEHTVTVRQPVAEVFAFLADGLNNPRWRPEVSGVRLLSDAGTAARAGARYAQTLTGPGGVTIPGDYLLTACEPPHRLEFEVVAGPGRPTGSFTLRESAQAGTEVVFALDLALTGALVALAAMIRKLAQQEVANLDNLQAALDS